MNDFLEMMFGGGSKMSPSQEMDALGQRREKQNSDEAALQGAINVNRHGGGGGADMMMNVNSGVLDAAGILGKMGDPRAAQAFMQNRGLFEMLSGSGLAGARGTRRKMGENLFQSTQDLNPHLHREATYTPQRAGRGGMMMPQAPAPEKQSQARLDLNDFYERRRERAGMQDQLNFRKQLLQQIMGHIGGGGQIHESGMHEQLFNNAGAPRAIPLRNESTRDMTPQERASLISAMLQGF